MKPFRSLQIVVAVIATFPMLSPAWTHSAFADDLPAATAPRDSVRQNPLPELRPVDVILEAGNLLTGKVITSLNVPIADTELIVTQGRQEVARVFTNEIGEFQVRLPKGGIYLLSTNRTDSIVRTWTATAAPPTAITSVTLVERLVVRGQEADCPPKRRHGKGLMLLGITAALAAAIAIPIVLLDRHEDLEKNKTTSP